MMVTGAVRGPLCTAAAAAIASSGGCAWGNSRGQWEHPASLLLLLMLPALAHCPGIAHSLPFLIKVTRVKQFLLLTTKNLELYKCHDKEFVLCSVEY